MRLLVRQTRVNHYSKSVQPVLPPQFPFDSPSTHAEITLLHGLGFFFHQRTRNAHGRSHPDLRYTSASPLCPLRLLNYRQPNQAEYPIRPLRNIISNLLMVGRSMIVSLVSTTTAMGTVQRQHRLPGASPYAFRYWSRTSQPAYRIAPPIILRLILIPHY